MRIGLFSDTYLPDINGVVSSIETLRQKLVENGHRCFFAVAHIQQHFLKLRLPIETILYAYLV